jgi:hypothetical protein
MDKYSVKSRNTPIYFMAVLFSCSLLFNIYLSIKLMQNLRQIDSDKKYITSVKDEKYQDSIFHRNALDLWFLHRLVMPTEKRSSVSKTELIKYIKQCYPSDSLYFMKPKGQTDKWTSIAQWREFYFFFNKRDSLIGMGYPFH